MLDMSENLNQVLQNVPKVYHAGQLNVVENAECLKGNKTDTAMLIDDVSPVEHTMGVKVHGKNLFDISQLKIGSNSKGLATTQTSFSFKNTYKSQTSCVECNIYLQVGTYYINGNVSLSDGLNGGWSLRRGGTFLINNSSRGTVKGTITITEAREYILAFYCNYSSEAGTTAEYSNIQLEIGTTATDYEPYNSDIQNVHSKNLIVYPYAETTKTVNGVTFTDNGNGSITVSGTATADSIFYVVSKASIQSGKYTLSGGAVVETSGSYRLGLYTLVGSTYTYSYDYGEGVTLEIPDNAYTYIFIKVYSGTTVKNLVFKPQLEYGSTATTYTKYHEPYPLVISRYGKNLWDKDYASNLSNWYILPDGAGYCKITIKIPKGTQYTVSYQKKLSTGLGFYFYINNSQKNWMYHSSLAGLIKNTITLTDSQGFIDIVMGGYPSLKKFMENIGNDLQIEISPTATAYEPYILKTDYTPTADGTVEGVESLYPSTTLLTNDPYGKVYIDCDYYKDIDKTFNELTTSVALSGGE